jgi:hypothetical protein
MKHRWGSKRSKCQIPHCIGPMLTYLMENKMSFVHHVIEQWGCGCIIKDDKGLNERTRRHPMMKPMSKLMCVGWEQGRVLNCDDHKGFGLNELDV